MLIVHISDLHLTANNRLAYGVADTLAAVSTTCDLLARMRPTPDIILVTGDIADDGSWESYQTALDLFNTLPCPVFMVPGNHDHKGRLAHVFADHTYLHRPVQGTQDSYLCYALEDFPLLLIGLDTVHPGRHGGGLDKDRLSWLKSVLSKNQEKPTVLFMHHPPFASGIGHMDQAPFACAQDFHNLLSRNPQVQRVLCGHLHRSITRPFAGCMACVAPGIGMQLLLDLTPKAPSQFILEPPAYLIHTQVPDWQGGLSLTTHMGVVPMQEAQFGAPHPFFNVILPSGSMDIT